VTLQLALGVTLLVGLPVLLLAIGVLAHARMLARQRTPGPGDELVETMVAEAVEQLLVQLRGSGFDGIRPASAAMANTPPRMMTSMAATPPRAGVTASRPPVPPAALATVPSGANLVYAVSQLVAEGLSDRSIARRLSVGVDEVRVARAARGAR
jgi:hypothetical protein